MNIDEFKTLSGNFPIAIFQRELIIPLSNGQFFYAYRTLSGEFLCCEVKSAEQGRTLCAEMITSKKNPAFGGNPLKEGVNHIIINKHIR